MLQKLISICFVLILAVSQCWSAEPTLARLGFWVPSERITEFEAVYQKQVVPILKQHGLKAWSEPTRATVDSVFARVFAFKTPAEFVETDQALLSDPVFGAVLRNLGSTFGTTRADGLIEMDFRIYRSPTGPGKRVAAGFGQGYWRTYSVSEGLAGNKVVGIFQDREGMLWFSAYSGGITRYDGETFTTFTAEDGLVNNYAQSIIQDQDGDLWINTSDGVSRYDGKTFTTFTPEDGQAPEDVGSVFQDREGIFWFSTRGGLIRYDGETSTKFTTKDGLASNGVRVAAQDHEGVLWLSTGGRGVSRYDGKTFSALTTQDGLVNNSVRKIFQDQEGNLWFGTRGGVSRYDGKTFTNFTTKDGLPSNNVRSIFQDREGGLWFGHNRGVSRYDPSAASISSETRALKTDSQIFTNFNTKDGLAANDVWAIFQDREGALWFGTLEGGVSRYDRQTFATFTTQNGLVDNRVMSIAQDREGALWFGTRKGASRYDGETFTTRTIQDGWRTGDVYSIFQNREGQLWFSTYRGLSRYDGETFTNFTAQDGLGRFGARTIAQDREGAIWTVRRSTIVRYDPSASPRTGSPAFTTFTTQDGLPPNRIASIFQDRDGMLWFGTYSSGVSRYDGEAFTTFTTQDGLAHNRVDDIFQDREGVFWFGTPAGLSRYDPSAESMPNKAEGLRTGSPAFSTFTTQDGLAHNFIGSIFQDREGVLWFGTRGGGVSRYDGQTFVTLTTKDGLADNNVHAIVQDPEGSIWFGTHGGVTRYRQPAPVPPSVFIDVVLADRRYKDASDIAIPSSVELTMFEFHANSFKTRPEAMVYRYRLKGYEENWKNTHARLVEYENLPRGTYTFEVQAVDRDLVYSERPATVALTVHWPYERMGWMSALGIAIVLIGWQAVRIIRRDQRLHETNEALSAANHNLFGLNKELQENAKTLELASVQAQQANKAKSRFLASMSHELRTPLNGILGYAQILNRDKELNEKQRDGVGIIRRSGEHLLGLINDILDLARIEAEKVELEEKEIRLPAFLKNVSAITGVKAQEKGLVFAYDPPSDLPEVVRGDPRRLRQVLLNLLGNAVKFTEQGDVRLSVTTVSQTEDQIRLHFEVEDTGVGMTETETKEVFKPFEQAGGAKQRADGTGLGLAISQQLVGLMGGEILAESSPGEGSRFWFETDLIPVDGPSADVVPDERVPIGYKGDPLQVLVVDDKPENRAVLVSLLEPLGFDVREAEDGQACLDMARESKPDVILLDLVMPVLDGFEATRQLRLVPDLKDTVVIALSASVFEHERQQSLDAGCTDFLPKPVQAEDLLEKMGQHLNLEWTYEAGDEADLSSGDMVIPPADAMKPLFDVAQKGQIFALDEHVDRIAQLGDAYQPFVSHVQKLAQDFKVDQICTLIKPHLGGKDER